MSDIVHLPVENWDASGMSAADRAHALARLEAGDVLFFPRLECPVDRIQPFLLSGSTAAGSKNASFDPASGKLRGIELTAALGDNLKRAMSDYVALTTQFLRAVFPAYAASLVPGRTSFRPVEIATRQSSWRKDDTRLHVDSFPATPVQGKRILRIFSNLNPEGESRSWRIGEPFEAMAGRFLHRIRPPLPGTSAFLELLHVTKTRRTLYDHYMLALHDAMKADAGYQANAPQIAWDFPAGTTWLVFTDQVSHAAMAGRCAFEQTFYLPVRAMKDEGTSPLRVLERLLGRSLT